MALQEHMIVFLMCFLFASACGNTQGSVLWGLSDGAIGVLLIRLQTG